MKYYVDLAIPALRVPMYGSEQQAPKLKRRLDQKEEEKYD